MEALMNSAVEKADAFLRELKIAPGMYQLGEYCELFIEQMSNGLQGLESSLKMIPTYIHAEDEIPYNEDVIVIDAGGTNLRTAVVQFTENDGARISEFRKQGMPGVKREVSAQEFFSAIGDAVEPVYSASSNIGFCFSYAADITKDRDGQLVVFSKEIKAPEVIGKFVGKELLQEMQRRGYGDPKRLTLLNDTVATLLAGKADQADKVYSGYIGFILGTGTNTSYIEKNSNITKLDDRDMNKSQIINVESGNFKFPATPLDEEFFAATKDPGAYNFEKLIAGAYLGAYGHLVLKKAVDAGLFSASFKSRFERDVQNLTTITMDMFLHRPHDTGSLIASCCATDDDAVLAYRLLDRVIERAAKLTAVNLAATVIKSDAGEDPLHPVCINADGTTYYKTHNLKRYTEWYLHQFLDREMGRYYEFVHIDNSPILGAAIAGLIG